MPRLPFECTDAEYNAATDEDRREWTERFLAYMAGQKPIQLQREMQADYDDEYNGGWTR